MCGIFGIVGCVGKLGKIMLDGITKLEYRGYDSVGMLGIKEEHHDLRKDVGNVDTVNKKVKFEEIEGWMGIVQTRWATNGGVEKRNAHPHFNKEKTIFAVHNGIIENFEEIKSNLTTLGYEFLSSTDTEIIPHYFDHKIKNGKTVKEAIIDFMDDIEGTFAILLVVKGDDHVYALKRDSPLALGIGDGMNLLGSDIYAFNTITNKSIFFEDNEFAVIGATYHQFFDSKGNEIEKPIKEISLDQEEKSKEEYPHYMLKEILEQPKVARRLIESFDTIQKDNFDEFIKLIKEKKKIAFLSCGTSYHASLMGVSVLKTLGISARSVVASEWETFIDVDEDTFVIAISQSGETMDVVKPLKNAKKKGATIGCLVNVPYSTIQRLSDVSINILAGPEIAVASTKAFTNMNIALFQIAKLLGYKIDIDLIPDKITKTLDLRNKCKDVAKELYKKNDIYVLGKHFSYPIAREIALKFKEVDYIHAEGMMAGELKHGTLALIEENVPVISLIYDNNAEMLSSTQEVRARGAKIYEIGNKGKVDFLVPECNMADFAVYSTLLGHLISYEVGVLKGTEIDQCRNLAKSVTVL